MIKLTTDIRRPYMKKMENIYVLAFLFLFHFPPGGTYETHCSSGERVHTPREGHDVCFPCPRGTFIADEHHFFRECKPCTGIDNPDVEVLVSACNRTRDAVILCRGGFYRRKARNRLQEDRCEKCTECPFPARPCEGYYDTVCCPPNHDAVMTPDGVFVCKERPIVCGAGQFFRTSSEECLPCPAGTFMSDHSHTYKDCLTCEELSENNLTQAVVTRPCNRTAPTLFGCTAGYFRDPTQESLQIEAPCTPCRICNRSLTDCDMFHDAVCDNEDRMVSTVKTKLPVSRGDEITRKQLHGATDAQTNIPQSNKNDLELPNSPERTDYFWELQPIFLILMTWSILILVFILFPRKQSNLKADYKYDNTFHQWCGIERHGYKIRWFTIISLCILCIFQGVVIGLKKNPRFANNYNAVYTLMILSILIVMANAITFFVCLCSILRLRTIRQQVFKRMHAERCQLLTACNETEIERQTKDFGTE